MVKILKNEQANREFFIEYSKSHIFLKFYMHLLFYFYFIYFY